MNKKQKRTRNRILLAIALFVVAYAIAELLPLATWFGSQTTALWVEFALFLVPYLIAGYDVLLRAAKNIGHGQVFDENFLMSVATIGAFALVLFPDSDPHMAEGAAVMLFYQVGELFQSYAVGKSRKSIADMMDIAPEFANVERDGQLVQVDPYEVAAGDEIVVKPGERVPLDGVVVSGATPAGHRRPHRRVGAARGAAPGDEIISGCVNLTGLIAVRVTKPFGRVHREPASWSSWRTRPRRRPRPRTSSPASRATTRLPWWASPCCWPSSRRCCSGRAGRTGCSAGSSSWWCRARARSSSACRCRSSAASAGPRGWASW